MPVCDTGQSPGMSGIPPEPFSPDSVGLARALHLDGKTSLREGLDRHPIVAISKLRRVA